MLALLVPFPLEHAVELNCLLPLLLLSFGHLFGLDPVVVGARLLELGVSFGDGAVEAHA